MPDDGPHLQPAGAISFALATRLMISGGIAVVLHLYRDKSLTRTSTLMVCERQTAAGVLQTCRSHLRRLGIAEESQGDRGRVTAFPEPERTAVPERRKRPIRLPVAASL